MKLLALALLAGLLAPTPTHQAPTHQAQQQDRTWLALGDSYSSGEGIEQTPAAYSDTLGRDCRRATGGAASAWAVEAQRLAGTELRLRKPDFVACTGAITDEAPWQVHEARDREGSPDRWDLVTFSFGGNNIKFSEVIKGCLGARQKSWTDWRIGCVESEVQLRRRVDMLAGRERIDHGEYAGNITMPELLDLLAGEVVARGGDVVVTGYPNLIEEVDRWGRVQKVTGMCSGVSWFDVPMLRGVGAYLNQRLAEAVADANQRHRAAGVTFHFLDIAHDPYEPADGARHGRCTDDPWLNGITLGDDKGKKTYTNRSFHPNQKGHAATGRVLADYLRAHLDSTPPPGGANAVDQAFLGSWRSVGPANQPTSDRAYTAELTLRNGPVGTRIGDITYPGLDCSGSLTLVSAAPDKLVVDEHIDNNPGFSCTVDGTVTLTRTSAQLAFSYEAAEEPGVVRVTATLAKA